MKRIIASLILLPSALEAGLGWSQPPLEVKSVMLAVDLFNKGAGDAVFSAVLKYTLDDQGTPSPVQRTANAITQNNPVKDLLYACNVTGGLTKVSDGKASLEYEVTKTKAGEEPIVLLAKKTVELTLLRKAMTRHEEEIQNAGHPFLLHIDVYHSDEKITWSPGE